MTLETGAIVPKPNLVRRMYDWVLSWAETPHGAAALFVLAFAESSFFPVPPDVLLIALAVGAPTRAFRFALICTAGSVLGGMAGYGIGRGLWEAIDQLFFRYVPGFSPEAYAAVQAKYEQYNFWIVFTAGFTPIPYKLITVSAGAAKINFIIFLVASCVSRAARFYLISALLWKFGPAIKAWIDRYFNLLAIVFTVLLVAGFVAVRYLIH